MSINLKVELTAEQIKRIVAAHINDQLGSLAIDPQQVRFMVKSKQNYKSEWEPCDMKVECIPEVKVVVEDFRK